MAQSFTIPSYRYAALSALALRAEIQSHTGNDTDTSSILRCMERFGTDGSIRYYEMTPDMRRRAIRSGSTATWTVRAVR